MGVFQQAGFLTHFGVLRFFSSAVRTFIDLVGSRGVASVDSPKSEESLPEEAA